MLINFHIFNYFFRVFINFLFDFKFLIFNEIVKRPNCPWAPPVRVAQRFRLADPPGPAQPTHSLPLSLARVRTLTLTSSGDAVVAAVFADIFRPPPAIAGDEIGRNRMAT
jgi:hypothetical protein